MKESRVADRFANRVCSVCFYKFIMAVCNRDAITPLHWVCSVCLQCHSVMTVITTILLLLLLLLANHNSASVQVLLKPHHMTAGNPIDHNHNHVQIHQSIHTAIHVWTASLLRFRPEQSTDCL